MSESETLVTKNTRSFNLRVFGCQMNVYDGELISASFMKRGWEPSSDPATADVVLFHTCSVREQAEERVHGLLGELRRRKKANHNVVIGVIGCMADREGRELFDREPHVDIVCGSRHFPELPDMVERVLGGEERICELGESPNPVDEPERNLAGFPGGYQAHVAVMRGCDLNCTYCIVPSVRGRVESRPAAEIVQEVARLVEHGVTEVHLLGQTIDSYGRDLPKEDRPDLALLLDELESIERLKRIRLVTLHPSYVDQRLADAMARSSKFMRLLPVPMQSGSDEVLKNMKRGYNSALYRQRIGLLRDAMPDLELVSDWIVGFPGESDQDFDDTLEALEEHGFLQSYVFQYSPRPGTVAFEIEDDVPKKVKANRNHRMLDLQRQIARQRTPQLVGQVDSIMLESRPERSPGKWLGRTRNGHYALIDEQADLAAGREIPVNLVAYNGRELVAELRGDLEEVANYQRQEFHV
ncbi:MAG: tRNA (N6-isopentenyl adenosine(37)-C2)-methylthiotransferase MiaB [Planctomycetes bacterium]|nr:tRNA (N6-isopentenyl adenosine(37)-C2)-methylthiotransferase MiaB [Planctomycetota bacterium]MCP4772471.1 tRNA (N6-isopentenyl adenosine(37)-C2)-methylthiotransferase MiaB [Planctomycetota bacterium]MCP4860136.1 tRNA (N6-isopentenyl adenosine(37)-C2)-methylthiotransferase MiaB [Planctomycetota bacterium]